MTQNPCFNLDRLIQWKNDGYREPSEPSASAHFRTCNSCRTAWETLDRMESSLRRMAKDCPSGERWVSLWEGKAGPFEVRGFRAHLALCAACREKGGDFERFYGETAAPTPSSRSAFGLLSRRFLWAAASVVLAVSLGWLVYDRSGEGNGVTGSPHRNDGFLNIRMEASQEQHAGSGAVLRVQDGSSFSRLGETGVNLDSGVVEVDVSPGRSGYRVQTPAADVRVLGTKFRVRALPVLFPNGGVLESDRASFRSAAGSSEHSGGVTFVEVAEGVVLLENGSSSVTVSSGALAMALEEGEPSLVGAASPLTQDRLLFFLDRMARELRENGTLSTASRTAWAQWRLNERRTNDLMRSAADDSELSAPIRSLAVFFLGGKS